MPGFGLSMGLTLTYLSLLVLLPLGGLVLFTGTRMGLGEFVARAVRDLGSGDFDLLILCIAGWIPSHAVISVLFPFRHRPMLLWGLAGWTEGDRLVTTADQAGTSALRKPMEDMGLRFRYLYEVHDRPPRMERVVAWAKACRAVRELEGARVGQMGYRDMRLYGTMFDGVSLRSRIGVEVEFFEMLEMVQRGERAAKDFASVLKDVAGMGYVGVEFAGLHGKTPAEVAAEVRTMLRMVLVVFWSSLSTLVSMVRRTTS